MSKIRFQRTPEQQIEHLRNILTHLQETLPTTRNRPATQRRTLVSNALEILGELEENLAHFNETGELKTWQ